MYSCMKFYCAYRNWNWGRASWCFPCVHLKCQPGSYVFGPQSRWSRRLRKAKLVHPDREAWTQQPRMPQMRKLWNFDEAIYYQISAPSLQDTVDPCHRKAASASPSSIPKASARLRLPGGREQFPVTHLPSGSHRWHPQPGETLTQPPA